MLAEMIEPIGAGTEPTLWPQTLIVRTEPVAKGRPRFGNDRTYTPTKTQHAEWVIRQAWVDAFGEIPSVGPLRLDVVVWLPIPKSLPKSRRQSAQPTKRPDVDNYAKTVLDGLDGVAYRDDAQIVDLRVRKRYAEFCGYWEIALSEVM
ncbi:MAG: RusA family crossover junction endodeoxyribonuclease [Candidatus Dormibacteraceae bacterium]